MSSLAQNVVMNATEVLKQDDFKSNPSHMHWRNWSAPFLVAFLSFIVLSDASNALLNYHIHRSTLPTIHVHVPSSVTAEQNAEPRSILNTLKSVARNITLFSLTYAIPFFVFFIFYITTGSYTLLADKDDYVKYYTFAIFDSACIAINFSPWVWCFSNLITAYKTAGKYTDEEKAPVLTRYTTINLAGVRVDVPRKFIGLSAILIAFFIVLASFASNAAECSPFIYVACMYTLSLSSMNKIKQMKVLIINWAMMSVAIIQTFVIVLPSVINGTRVPEEQKDDSLSYWPSMLAERLVEWTPMLFAYPISATQVTFAAYCLRFDYKKAVSHNGNLLSNSLGASTECSGSVETPRTRFSGVSSFPRAYYNISTRAWTLTHVVFLTYLIIMGSQISTATYALLSTLVTQPVMLIAVIAYALLKGDFLTMWRYDETDEIEKDAKVVKQSPFRTDLPLVFFRENRVGTVTVDTTFTDEGSTTKSEENGDLNSGYSSTMIL